MVACDKNIFYTGICNHDSKCRLDQIISCSKCQDPVKIVTVPYTLKTWTIPETTQFDGFSQDEGTDADFQRYGPFKTINNMILDQNKANLITTCEIPGLYKDNSVFPSNCAVQMVLSLLLYYYP